MLACAAAHQSLAAGETETLRALAIEKAAAVDLLKSRGAAQTAQLAQDRLFIAYLNATTESEGARLRARMEGVLTTILGRYGLSGAIVADRTGAVLVRAGTSDEKSEKLDAKRSPLMLAGFAAAAKNSVTRTTKAGVTHVTPVTWRSQSEFVLAADQSFTAYRDVLARNLSATRYIVLADEDGTILADTRKAPAKADKIAAGMTLAQLKLAVAGHEREGSGTVGRGVDTFNISYQVTGVWTVVAVESVPPPYRCDKNGDRLCG